MASIIRSFITLFKQSTAVEKITTSITTISGGIPPTPKEKNILFAFEIDWVPCMGDTTFHIVSIYIYTIIDIVSVITVGILHSHRQNSTF
jgi:hypothetical protein